MPDVPTDLVKLAEIVKQYHPSRSWWDTQIAQGKLTAYKIPGERGLYLSKAAVEEFMKPRPYVKGEDTSAG
jgi:hypothetical protein